MMSGKNAGIMGTKSTRVNKNNRRRSALILGVVLLLAVFNLVGDANAQGYDSTSLEFDGKDDRVVLKGPKNAFQHFIEARGTISLWVKPSKILTGGDRSNRQFAISAGGSIQPGHRDLNIGINTKGNWWLVLSDTKSYLAQVGSAKPKPEAGTWYHLAVVFGGSDRGMYINGTKQASWDQFSGNTGQWRHPLHLGFAPDTNRNWFGTINDVRFYDRNFDASEVREVKNSAEPLHEEHLVGYWPVVEGNGATVHDRSGNGMHGQIKGARWTNEFDVRLILPEDDEKLARIAQEHEDHHVRVAAISKMSDDDFVSLDHEAPAVRHAAVLETNDQEVLARVAVEDESDAVRLAAMEKLSSDAEIFTNIALNDDSARVRKTAVQNITDRNVLAQIALNDNSQLVRSAAAKKVDPNDLLQRAVEMGDKTLTNAYVESDGVHVERGPSQVEEGNELSFRFTKDEASVDFKLDCNPDQRNYVTVKVWGSSGSKDGQLLLGHKKGVDLTKKHAPEGVLTWQRIKNPLPGRFYYATRPLPKSLTDGQSTVKVTLGYKGSSPGPQVYNIYCHQEAFFEPPEDELQGDPFELGPPRPDKGKEISAKEAFKHWESRVNRAFKEMLSGNYTQKEWDNSDPGLVQIFGEKYKKLIEQGKIPAWTYGAILARRPGLTEVPEPYSRFDSEYKAWGGILIEIANMNPGTAFSVLLAFAHAYEHEWSDYHQDEEILERFTAAMDFYSRAQGAGGVWQGPKLDAEGGGYDGWTSWIGAPNRKDYKGQLFSMGQKALWPAYNMLHDDLKRRGILDERIDHDLDPDTPEIPRREAYGKMPLRSFEFFEDKVVSRGVTNQVIHNFEPLWKLYEVLQKTNPEAAAEKRERMHELAEITAGVRRNPGPDLYMYSPKGLINEGGYSTKGYGSFNVGAISKMAKYTGFDWVEERAADAFEAYSHFYYLGNNARNHRKLNIAEWITRRNEAGFPGTTHYLTNEYAAEELEIPAAIRHFELHDEHNMGNAADAANLREIKPLGAYGNTASATHEAARLAEDAWEAMKTGEELIDLPSTEYRLPGERNENSAFADEHIESIAFRYNDATMFLRFYWPNGNTRAILRYMTPEYDRLVSDVIVNHSGPSKRGKWFNETGVLKTFRYGPYLIVLNGSEEKTQTFDVPEDMQGKTALELQSSKKKEFGRSHSISPSSSHVFVVPSMVPDQQ